MPVRRGYFIKCLECGRCQLFLPKEDEAAEPPKNHICVECKTKPELRTRKELSTIGMAKLPFDLKIRTMNLTPIDGIPEERRGLASELLVGYQLLKYGRVYMPQKGARYVGDRVLELDGSTVLVPVEVKKITRRSKRIIKIGKNFLEKFLGVYVVLIQRKHQPREYDFLIATSQEMGHKVKDEKRGKLGKHDKSHKKRRWHVRIPVRLKGWEGCLNEWSKVTGFSPGPHEDSQMHLVSE